MHPMCCDDLSMKRQQFYVMNDVTDIKCTAIMTTPISACSGMKKILLSEVMSSCCLYIHIQVCHIVYLSNRGCVGLRCWVWWGMVYRPAAKVHRLPDQEIIQGPGPVDACL